MYTAGALVRQALDHRFTRHGRTRRPAVRAASGFAALAIVAVVAVASNPSPASDRPASRDTPKVITEVITGGGGGSGPHKL
jgi:hypothetical protein